MPPAAGCSRIVLLKIVALIRKHGHMSDEQCPHDLPFGQCALCAPVPPGLTARVWITKGGAVYHRTTYCEALRDGQRKARRLGLEIHEPQNVPSSEVNERGACIVCFPDYRPSPG